MTRSLSLALSRARALTHIIRALKRSCSHALMISLSHRSLARFRAVTIGTDTPTACPSTASTTPALPRACAHGTSTSAPTAPTQQRDRRAAARPQLHPLEPGPLGRAAPSSVPSPLAETRDSTATVEQLAEARPATHSAGSGALHPGSFGRCKSYTVLRHAKFEHELWLPGVDPVDAKQVTGPSSRGPLRHQNNAASPFSTPTCSAASSSSSQTQSQPAARSPRSQQQPPRPAS